MTYFRKEHDMGYDSIRNKKLIVFPDGKLMLFAEISDSRTYDWRGRRCWSKTLFHPKDSLFFTTEALKATQKAYVEHQLKMMRDHSKWEVEHGYAKEYVEPTVESHDYNGTRWPSGCRIKNGRAFYGGKPIKAEDYFGKYGAIKRITFGRYEGIEYKVIDTYDILRADLDECYQDMLRDYGTVYIDVR